MIGLPAPENPPSRDSKGRTLPGNSLNKGKKYLTGQKVFEAAVTDEEVRLIARKLVEMSLDGNIKAIKLLLDRKLGKLVQPVEHDMTGRVVLVLPDNGRMANNGGTHGN